MPELRSESQIRLEAIEHVQARLAGVSFVIWMIVSFGIVIVFDLAHPQTQSLIIRAGGIALAVAAIPWVAYRPWIRREIERRRLLVA